MFALVMASTFYNDLAQMNADAKVQLRSAGHVPVVGKRTAPGSRPRTPPRSLRDRTRPAGHPGLCDQSPSAA